LPSSSRGTWKISDKSRDVMLDGKLLKTELSIPTFFNFKVVTGGM
jgi:hypothetical protein